VQWNTALAATTTATGSDPIGSATVSLAGGEVRFSDGGSGSNGSISAFAANNITLKGYTNADLPSQTNHNGTITLDNNSTANTGNVIQLNQLTFDSTGTSAIQTLTIQNASSTTNYSAKFTGAASIAGTATITTGANPANLELAGNLTGSGTLNKAGNNTLTLSGTSNFTGATNLTAGTILFNAATYSIGSLNISSGATASVKAGGTKMLSVASLSITSGGTLDLNDNFAIVNSGSLTTIKNLIATGYANGTWAGSGLTSSSARTVAANGSNIHKTALGYATATQLGVGSFDGQPVSGGNILVRYTLSGDATLNDTVNSSDFAILAANYGSTSATWAMGDFNYDGTVNALDFNALATNYGAAPVSGAVPEMALSLGSVVPEPSSFFLAVLAILPAARRRRRLR
jgi:autotransporter-associated beta strand protein